MKYLNMKTQAVITTDCELQGGNWVRVEEEQPKTITSTAVAVKEVEKKVHAKSSVKKTTTKKNTTSKTAAKTARKKSGE